MKRYIKASIYRRKYFLIKDLDCKIIIEETSRKDLLRDLDYYIETVNDFNENPNSNLSIPDEESFSILYADGSEDCINYEYDGHRIKRTGIVSIVYDNPMSSVVFGPYSINDSGVVYPSDVMEIDDNIEYVGED